MKAVSVGDGYNDPITIVLRPLEWIHLQQSWRSFVDCRVGEKHPRMTKRQRLFFAGHSDGTFGTDEGADPAAFAEIIIDFNVAGLLVSGDAEIRAKVAAQVAAPAEIVPEAPACLHNCRLFVKPWFDLIQVFSVLLLRTALDFQFT